jgi:hypothetical protein
MELKEDFKRINKSSVTEALMEALENADNMKHVFIVYETIDGNKDSSGGIIAQEDTTLGQLNYLLDKVKAWIFA